MKSFGPLKISVKYQIKKNYYFATTVQVQVNNRPDIHVRERRKSILFQVTFKINITFFRFPKSLSLKLFDLGFVEAAEDDFPFSLDTSVSGRVSSVSCHQQLLVAL